MNPARVRHEWLIASSIRWSGSGSSLPDPLRLSRIVQPSRQPRQHTQLHRECNHRLSALPAIQLESTTVDIVESSHQAENQFRWR
jgi:hypothetical protein